MVQNNDNKKILDVGQLAFRHNMLNGNLSIMYAAMNHNPFSIKLNGRDLFYLGR